MNNFLLFISILNLYGVVLWNNDGDFVAPAPLMCTGFLTSAFFLMINTANWEYCIRGKTIFIIIITIISFLFGCFLAKHIRVTRRKIGITNIKSNLYISSKRFIFILLVLMIGCLAIRLINLYLSTGGLSIFAGSLQAYRYNRVTTKFSFLIRFTDAIVVAIVIYTVLQVVDKLVNRQKNTFREFGLLILGLIYYTLSSSRIEVIYIFVYVIVAYLLKNKLINKKISLKALRFVIVAVVGLFGLFFLIGYLTGKSQVQSSIFDNLSLYIGSSIGALDTWITNFHYSGEYFGSIVLQGITNFFAIFGIQTKVVLDPTLTFINLGKMRHTTNVYSCVAELLSDVGFAGMIVVLIFEGFIVQKIYKCALVDMQKGRNLMLCIYLYVAPLVVLSSVAERFFSTFLTVSTVLFVVCIKIFMRVKGTRKGE